ncbi:hypothetical protein ADK86_21625 [Streptomyces sp. NRRL F-5755]|uniref:hypothetical protein n=1 Tax=Streptomyces sp. NRRL F-5755 TaxID=1519475 RepID=UPI0006AE0C64|nr:hypothetical protein [Streptomyces sp. NRRL F-5755]KOT91831.1 hypothetical protein ADK86_21625 [Streptomyces sp. NRRL F-5755]
MSGEQIAHIRNRINATRVVDVDNDVVLLEYSATGSGQVLGNSVTDVATHVSKRYADGTETATARFVVTSESGQDQLALVGSAAGVVAAGGAVTFEGVLTGRATSGVFAELNGVAILAEATMDADGMVTHSWRRF